MTAMGEYFPYGVNLRVANMEYAADVNLNGPVEIDLGAPAAADADGLVDGQSIAAAGEVSVAASTEAIAGKFGRNVTVVASGAATSLVTVHGYDYLGQPMSENYTLNGATPVVGKKAFRHVSSVEYAATAATTIDVGFGAILGLPYKMIGDAIDYTDKVRSGTQGTYVVGADTQTATSNDPRGTFAPHSTVVPNGARRYMVSYRPDRENLHGEEHFSS